MSLETGVDTHTHTSHLPLHHYLENNLAQWYTNQGWTPNTSTASTWQHDLTHLTIRGPPHSPQTQATTPDIAPDPPARHSHKLREAWRATQYQAWATSTRVDATEAQPPPYNEQRVQAARKAALPSTHHFSILTGGAVSKAHHAIMTSQGPPTDIAKQCYDCPEVGTWTHTCCIAQATHHQSQPLPTDSRLGWPRVGMHQQNFPHHNYNETVLAHMVATRTYLLTKRYDTPEQHPATTQP